MCTMKKIRLIIFITLIASVFLTAEVKPQAGIESYIGSNSLLLVTPWVGLRVKLKTNISLLLKYYNHNIRFNYINTDGQETKRTANLSNFTTAIYAQLGKHHAYSALSYFTGSDSYNAIAFDGGLGIKIMDKLTAEAGIYLLNENSILWYPDENERDIFLYSFNGGVKYKLTKWLSVNPKIYLYKNSEDASATSYSIGAIISPKDPVYISVIYLRYSESARYKFSGDYISIGLNFYY